ncbi:MAG: helix-turn-helix transcriptional regulator [Clostridia bacterium]|nr:helix-turn-helix transcriptional regulator [Clostridia bacterium]
MDNQKTGKFIAECRKNLGYNQKELAEKLNITDKAVSKWETGRSSPDISLLTSLAEVLNVSVVEILNGEKISKEEISNVSDEIVVKSLKKSKSKKILAIILALVLSLSIFVSYPIYQYTNSIATNDYYTIASIIRDRLGAENIFQYACSKIEVQGDYTAYLYHDEEKAYMVFFKQNKLFKTRMNFEGGTSADLSELGMYSLICYGENINIFFSAETNAKRYEFSIKDVDYSVPIYDEDFVNIFVEKSNIYYNAANFEFIEE